MEQRFWLAFGGCFDFGDKLGYRRHEKGQEQYLKVSIL